MISNDRKNHIWAVAEFLKNYAVKQNFPKQDIENLFTLGLLHDIGYEFCDSENYSNHNIIGGNLLKQQKFKLWKEVYYHGTPNSPYQSLYLDLLNWADMHIDHTGNFVSYEERLKEISSRYNKPIKELACYKIVYELKQKGFN